MQIAVNGEENFVVLGCEGEQFAILLAGPARFLDRSDLVSNQLFPESLVDTFIQQDAHAY